MDSTLGRAALWALDETNIIVTSCTTAWVLKVISDSIRTPVALVVQERDSSPSSHPAGAIFFVLGACSTCVVAKVLKRLLRESRPPTHKPSSSSALLRGASRETYGMPSTHSATISFFATFIFTSLWSSRPVLGTAAVAMGGTIAWSRVALGHHTVPQVLAGAALGVTSGFSWYHLWNGLGGHEGLRGVGEGYWDLAKVVAQRVWAQM